MSRVIVILFAAKGIRTFCYGFLGVLFPIHLARAGMSATGIGIAIALTLFTSALFTLAVRGPAKRLGSSSVLAMLSGLIVLSGALFGVATHPWLIVLAAMIGNIAVGTGESGPFLTLEQIELARAASKTKSTQVYSAYNMMGYLAAAVGAALVSHGKVTDVFFFATFAVAGILQMGLYTRLSSPKNHVPAASSAQQSSRPFIHRIALLFSLDSFAGGFVTQSLVLYWLHVQFNLPLETLGLVSAATQMMTAVSYMITPSLAARFGLVQTMVFTHIFANLVLMAIYFAPTASWAIGLLLFRSLFSQIDVPTRQAYLMNAVEDHEREAAASLTNTSRALAQSVSPALTGWVMETLALSAPFLMGGSLKIAYDLMLYATIKRR